MEEKISISIVIPSGSIDGVSTILSPADKIESVLTNIKKQYEGKLNATLNWGLYDPENKKYLKENLTAVDCNVQSVRNSALMSSLVFAVNFVVKEVPITPETALSRWKRTTLRSRQA